MQYIVSTRFEGQITSETMQRTYEADDAEHAIEQLRDDFGFDDEIVVSVVPA